MHIILDRKKEEGNKNSNGYKDVKWTEKMFLEALVRNIFICELSETCCERMILINEVRIGNNDDLIVDSHWISLNCNNDKLVEVFQKKSSYLKK